MTIKPATIRWMLCLYLLPMAAHADRVSMAVIPDTQFYAEQSPEILEAQIDWIIANRDRENIIYVAHLGDLKDDVDCDTNMISAGTGGGRSEWQIVSDAFARLESNNIPYGVVPGNHDFDSINNNAQFGCPNWDTQRPLSQYNDFNTGFPPSRFSTQPWYGDPGVPRPGNRVPGSNEDNFTLFESNGLKFIAINLAYRPAANAQDNNPLNDDAPELTWADARLKEYPDRIGFITSHYFMEQNAEVGGNPSPCVPGACARDCPAPTNVNELGSYGQEVYDSLSDNPNLLMMLSAHWFGEAWRIEDRSAAGQQPVQILLQDYQGVRFPSNDGDPNTPPNAPDAALIDFGNLDGSKCNIGDSGFMRIFRFDTDNFTVEVETFIPPVLPIQNRPGTLVSTYFPADGTGMDKDTASNLSFPFAGYATLDCNHLWVLDNVDPDFSNPPFTDVLSVYTDLDPAGTPALTAQVSNLNTSQTIGGQSTIAVFGNGLSALVADWTGDTLTRYRIDGSDLGVDWTQPIDDMFSVAISQTGDAYALAGSTLPGDRVLRIDKATGQIIDSAQLGGVEIAIDDANDAIWVVGASIRKLDRDLNLLAEVDPIGWAGVSAAPATDGTLWVAERELTAGSADRLLKISSDGLATLLAIPLPATPFDVVVDPNDDSVWVALLQTSIRKYDAGGNLLLDIPVDAYTIGLDPGDGSLWVGERNGDLARFAADGTSLDSIPRGLGSADTRIALTGFCGL